MDQPWFHEVKRYLEAQEYPEGWFHEVKRYLDAQEYLEGASVNDKKFLRIFSAKFFLSNGIFYKRNHDSVLLRCVDKVEAEKIMAEL